jgi:hypothetical protein
MGKYARQGLQPLSFSELAYVARALELCLSSEASVKGVSWPSSTSERRNYRVSAWLDQGRETPLQSTWIAERHGDVFRLLGRPANHEELVQLFEALLEVGAASEIAEGPIAEAHYDCKHRTFQLTFTPFEQMREGLPYRRWIFREHGDGRPLSVGYITETRRGDGYATLPDGATLRGAPWAP